MKRKQSAKSTGEKGTWREKYRQAAIQLLKQEGGKLKILDIESVQDAIQIDLGREVKIDELITAFKRKNCGLRIDVSGSITFVSLISTTDKKREEGKREKKTEKKAAPKGKARRRTPRKKNTSPFLKPDLTVEQFVLLAIMELRKKPYKGIHTVFSGFNGAFREYFPGLDPVEEVNKLVEAGKVDRKYSPKGATIYLPGEGPKPEEVEERKPETALRKMGLIK